MNCSACGAPLSILKCNYCGHLNVASNREGHTSDSEDLEERQHLVENLKSRIEKLRAMPMPEVMKTKKMELLEKELMELVSKN